MERNSHIIIDYDTMVTNMKFWQNWPYWLKGGVIGGGVGIIYETLLYSCSLISSWGSFGCGVAVLVAGPLYPVWWLESKMPMFYVFEQVELYRQLTDITILFVFGSIVGILINYFKSNKKSSS